MVSNQNVLPQVFEHEKFGKIRTVIIDDVIYFVGKDVATALGYSNTKDALAMHVDAEDKKILQRSENATFGIPNRGLTVVNESGLYSLILSSKLPKAKEFKRWVTNEVLPQIRKYGFYSLDDENKESDVEKLFEHGLDTETLKAIEESDKLFRSYTKLSPDCEILPKSCNILIEDYGNDLRCVYRYVIRKERVFVPFIYYPKYFESHLVFTKRDIMGLLDISEGRFFTAFKHLKNKIEFQLLRGVELGNFQKNNPISEKATTLYIFPRESVYAFFEHFGVEIPEELKKVSPIIKKIDTQCISDFINQACFLNERLKANIEKFTDEMICNGVVLKTK